MRGRGGTSHHDPRAVEYDLDDEDRAWLGTAFNAGGQPRLPADRLEAMVWRLEVANAFQAAIRRRRITAAYRDASLSALLSLPITIDADTDTYAWTTTLRLSERFGLTVYDAAYLELAQRRNLSLATLDEDLRRAASQSDIACLGLAG